MLNEIYHSIDPVAFSVGPFAVRWYGLAYVVGFICVGVIVYRTAKRWKIALTPDDVLTIILGIVIGVILGARLGYVAMYGRGYYLQHPAEILAFSQGGMSFHGGLVGAILGGFVASRVLKMPFLTVADLCVIGAPVGLFLGRCANFVNGELWGAETSMPWGVVFGGAAGEVARHPSQLYEALLEGVLLFVVLYVLSRKVPARARGTFLGVFMVGYGICRFLVEFVRQPDVQLGYLAGGWFTMGQALSLPLLVVGAGLLIWAARVKLPQRGVQGAAEDVS